MRTSSVNFGERDFVLKASANFSALLSLILLSIVAVVTNAGASMPTLTTQEFGSTVLTAVGCLGDGSCIAFDGGVRGDVYVMSNGVWDLGPSLPDDQYGLQIWPEQISCSNDDTCTIIGNDQQSVVSEVWQHGAWQSPVIADYQATNNDSFHFKSISCYAIGDCLAIGWVPYGQLDESFSIEESGGTWQAPVMDRNLLDQYESVSCWSSSDCEVAGFVSKSGLGGSAGSTVWEVADGQFGSPSTIYQSGWLTSISCPSSGACVAVGSSQLTKSGAGAFPIESSLSSGTWSAPVEPDLENVGLGSWYTSVSCLDANDCLAVGVTYGEFDDIYSTFQNEQWATPTTTTPIAESTSTTSGLYGSACSSAGFCIGTGWYVPEGNESCLSIMVTFRTELENTSIPTVTGNPTSGNTLTASPGIWTGTPTFSYQWNLNGSPISGATSDSYEITAQDIGAVISVEVTASDGLQSLSAQSSNVEVEKGELRPVLRLIYTSPVKIGTVLTASVSGVPLGATVHFRWILDGLEIPGATQSSLKITSAISDRFVWFNAKISCNGYTTITKISKPVLT